MKYNKKRLSKKDYFTKRYNEAIANGMVGKAAYYEGRLNQLVVDNATWVTHNKAPLSEAEKQSRIKARFEALSEGDRLIAMNKFIKDMAAKGITINKAVAFLTSCGLDSTEISHATTF